VSRRDADIHELNVRGLAEELSVKKVAFHYRGHHAQLVEVKTGKLSRLQVINVNNPIFHKQEGNPITSVPVTSELKASP